MNDFNNHQSNGFNQYHNEHDNDYYDNMERQTDFSEQAMIRPFYEEVWFIILMLIFFWPAGLMCALWRFLHDRQIKAFDPNQTTPPLYQGAEGENGQGQTQRPRNVSNVSAKRSCRGMRVGGWILVVLGACFVLSGIYQETVMDLITTLATAIGFLIAGGLLLLGAKKTVAKWDRYESFINKKGNTSIPWLADKMGLPEKNVRVDVQSMINKGFFDKPSKGISAYINGEYDLIVMTKYDEVMEPLRKAKPVKKEEQAPANSYLGKLQEEIDRTTDQELLATLRDIEGSIKKIEAKIQEEPSLKNMTSIRKLKETYLPQTLELIRKFNDGEGSDETRWEIKAMLATCAKAFKNIQAKVYERDDIDTKVDMEVLKKTLEREGLLGSDFNIEM